MLKGKPAGESEQVTMDAIRSVLTDAEKPNVAANKNVQRAQHPVQDLELTTQPVTDVETKMQSARFTTIPSPTDERQLSLSPEPMQKAARLQEIVEPEKPQAPIPAPKEVAKKVFRLPRLPKIDLTKAVPSRSRVARKPLAKRQRFLENRHIVALALIVLTAFRPGLVAAALFVWFFGMVALFLLLGADRIWRALSWAVRTYKSRNKEGAENLLDFLDGVAVRWDAVLDRFPDGMVDTLYMPDFANLENLDEEYDAVLNDRYNRMHSQV